MRLWDDVFRKPDECWHVGFCMWDTLLLIRFREFCLLNIFIYPLTEKAEIIGRNRVTLLPFYL